MNRPGKILFATVVILGLSSLQAEEKLPPQTLFKNVNVFNGTEDKLYENHQLLIEGNTIKAISAGEIEAMRLIKKDGVIYKNTL